MLLTSGQVSVAITSFVVFLFTSALFLSGYVLQQQTVRDLRAAIKPKPTPEAARLYLPTQFAVKPTPSPKADTNVGLGELNDEARFLGNSEGLVVVKESNKDSAEKTDGTVLDDAVEGRRTQGSRRPQQDTLGNLDGGPEQSPAFIIDEQSPGQEILETPSIPVAEDKSSEEKPMGRAERRRKIKEEIMAAGEGEGFKGYKRRQW